MGTISRKNEDAVEQESYMTLQDDGSFSTKYLDISKQSTLKQKIVTLLALGDAFLQFSFGSALLHLRKQYYNY